MPHSIQLPRELYDALRKKAAAQQKSADALVIEWVSAHLDEAETSEINRAFEQEVAAFDQLRPALVEKYGGQFVAIYQGEVVASGSDKLVLLDRVRERLGNVVCYIEKVAPDFPRPVRMPAMRRARS